METTLGPPNRIEVTLPQVGNECPSFEKILSPQDELIVCLFDWCQHILKTTPLLVTPENEQTTSESQESKSAPCQFQISYSPCRRKNADISSMSPQVFLKYEEATETYPDFPRIEVTCAHGSALLTNANEISWQTPIESASESLTAERTAFEVMLDHFCRRVVGADPCSRLGGL
ncbi:MAG: hypothetical protein R3C11_04710 [Planctomycetaceae bacterium]